MGKQSKESKTWAFSVDGGNEEHLPRTAHGGAEEGLLATSMDQNDMNHDFKTF